MKVSLWTSLHQRVYCLQAQPLQLLLSLMMMVHSTYFVWASGIIGTFLSCCVVFMIEFTEEDYSFDEGAPDATVCLQGIGEIAQDATAIVSSLNTGTATG